MVSPAGGLFCWAVPDGMGVGYLGLDCLVCLEDWGETVALFGGEREEVR